MSPSSPMAVTSTPLPHLLSSSKRPAITNRWWRTMALTQKRERRRKRARRREEKDQRSRRGAVGLRRRWCSVVSNDGRLQNLR
ncbi:hypothetical protein HanPSC8_Chr17g0788771 [Helianthus annuus]|nr:hypothetical protein HanIR_Chr17g0888961 [Helianthus annuus]KAJ0814690.1 hypothetical protein HanPSC8_Chr17g0788771 [Helianthus annuus]